MTDEISDDPAVIEDDEAENLPADDVEAANDAEEVAATVEDGESDDGEVQITIGDDPAPEDDEVSRAPAWVRDLRKQNRELVRKLREVEQRGARHEPAVTDVVIGAKPTLEACEYDAEKFETELEAWHSRKREADEAAAKKRAAAEAQEATWKAKLSIYEREKTALKVPDFEDAEAAVQDTFNVVQQAVLVQGAQNKAALVYALGKNPKRAKALAAITDPVEFAWAAAKLETEMKMTPKKVAPAPERTVRGSAPSSGSVDSTLDRLRAEAEKTGDMTKVIRYKQQLRNKQAA